MQAHQINLERLFPQFLNESWTIDELAEKCGCGRRAADEFLDRKREEVTAATSGKIVGLAVSTWNTLERRAVLDRKALDRLNAAEEAGEEVSDKLVSSVVKRLIALINIARSQTPNRTPFQLAGGDAERLVGGSLNRK